MNFRRLLGSLCIALALTISLGLVALKIIHDDEQPAPTAAQQENAPIPALASDAPIPALAAIQPNRSFANPEYDPQYLEKALAESDAFMAWVKREIDLAIETGVPSTARWPGSMYDHNPIDDCDGQLPRKEAITPCDLSR